MSFFCFMVGPVGAGIGELLKFAALHPSLLATAHQCFRRGFQFREEFKYLGNLFQGSIGLNAVGLPGNDQHITWYVTFSVIDPV